MKDVLWAGLGEVKREDLIRWEVVSSTKEKVVWVAFLLKNRSRLVMVMVLAFLRRKGSFMI